MYHISDIREKAKEKRNRLETENKLSHDERKRIDLIDDLLSYDACFANLPMELGMILLVYLGYSKENVKEFYPDLVREAMVHMKGKYILVDPQGFSDNMDT